MSETQHFQRLEQAVSLIARHPYYPGKQDAVDECLEDIEERCRLGILTEDQKSRLVSILVSADALEYVASPGVAGARGAS